MTTSSRTPSWPPCRPLRRPTHRPQQRPCRGQFSDIQSVPGSAIPITTPSCGHRSGCLRSIAVSDVHSTLTSTASTPSTSRPRARHPIRRRDFTSTSHKRAVHRQHPERRLFLHAGLKIRSGSGKGPLTGPDESLNCILCTSPAATTGIMAVFPISTRDCSRSYDPFQFPS